jgi:hypothetical protein
MLRKRRRHGAPRRLNMDPAIQIASGLVEQDGAFSSSPSRTGLSGSPRSVKSRNAGAGSGRLSSGSDHLGGIAGQTVAGVRLGSFRHARDLRPALSRRRRKPADLPGRGNPAFLVGQGGRAVLVGAVRRRTRSPLRALCRGRRIGGTPTLLFKVPVGIDVWGPHPDGKRFIAVRHLPPEFPGNRVGERSWTGRGKSRRASRGSNRLLSPAATWPDQRSPAAAAAASPCCYSGVPPWRAGPCRACDVKKPVPSPLSLLCQRTRPVAGSSANSFPPSSPHRVFLLEG